MAGIPKVKIQFDADFDDLKKGVKGATNEIEGFGSKVGDFAKKAGVAFAIAGAAAAAYAGKLLIDGVKSAIEDEAAQAKLATTLKNVAGATDLTIAATEGYILKTSLATGKTDNELRPSLERLARATGDVTKAQELQSLALNIAAGSGKSLEAVSNALGKAYEGSNTALSKLGVGLSSAELKTMSFTQITAALGTTFKDQASIAADTFAGKMSRLKVAFDEGKETVGSFVLDAVTPLVTTLVNNVIPKISELSSNIGETLKPTFQSLSGFLTQTLIPAFKNIYSFFTQFLIPTIMNYLTPAIDGLKKAFDTVSTAISNNSEKLKPFFELMKTIGAFARDILAPIFGTVLRISFEVIGQAIAALITGFAAVVSGVNAVVNSIRNLIALVAANPLVQGVSNLISSVFGGGRAAGGSVSSGTPYVVGEKGAELFVPQSNGTIIPNNAMGGTNSTTINLTVNGAIDSEGTARQIINLLNNSFYRGTSGAGALVFP
jgi:hypothetical protein